MILFEIGAKIANANYSMQYVLQKKLHKKLPVDNIKIPIKGMYLYTSIRLTINQFRHQNDVFGSSTLLEFKVKPFNATFTIWDISNSSNKFTFNFSASIVFGIHLVLNE